MEREINIKTDKVTVAKGSNSHWNNITSIDFGGAEVEFSEQSSTLQPFKGNTTITSITNATITNDNLYDMFNGCSNLTTLNADFLATTGGHFYTDQKWGGAFVDCSKLESIDDCNFENIVDGGVMFLRCNALTNVTLNLPNATDVNHLLGYCSQLQNVKLNIPKATNLRNLFISCSQLKTISADIRSLVSSSGICKNCSSLEHVELIAKSTNSGWTQSDFSIPSTAPCNTYRYVHKFDYYGTLMKLIFTNEYWDVVNGDDVVYVEDGGRYMLCDNYTTFQLQPKNTSLTPQTFHLTLTNRNTNAYEYNLECRIIGNGDSDFSRRFYVNPLDVWEGDVTMHTDDGYKWIIDSAVRTN